MLKNQHKFLWILTLGLYRLLIQLALPFLLVGLWLKGTKNPAYRQRWRERLGFYPTPKCAESLWIHAVSVGEFLTVIPLIEKLSQSSQIPILVTTMTPTASALVSRLKVPVTHVYFPYDVPWIVKRFLKHFQPKLCVIVETEIWPNCLIACQKQNVPVAIINARLSPRSRRGYAALGLLMEKILDPVKLICAQSEEDAKAFVELGCVSEKVIATGNMKCDLQIVPSVIKEGKHLRQQIGSSRKIWIAASTHAGEEGIFFSVYQKLKSQFHELILILVPRHPERFSEVATLAQHMGLTLARRSLNELPALETDLYLGDTMGELLTLYAAADFAVVGGSYVPIGGHNVLEPAALGLPMIIGPHYHNFVELTESLRVRGALEVVEEEQLVDRLQYWLGNPTACHKAGASGQQFVTENQGSTDQILVLLRERFLGK